jgi:RNA polymerase sigma factor (sigma-70 family)
MVKSLGNLDKTENFWPWMYRIAQSKIQQHYRAKQQTTIKESAFYKDFVSRRSDHQDDGLRQLFQKDLSKKVIVAMKQIKQEHRAVLSLRCFEQLSYEDIATTLQCSEVSARVMFYRAKQALKKQLVHRGVRKSFMLMCLGLFGRLTAPVEAASSNITVTAASARVGLIAVILATASTKLGIATMTAAAVGLVGVGSVSVLSGPPLPKRAEVRNLHFTTQLRLTDTGPYSSLSKGAYEQWYSFPDGIDGPMFMRMQRWTPRQDTKYCAWLQDAQANYYYFSDDKQVYINNFRVFWSSLKVWRLPTDTAEFTNFLSQVEGQSRDIVYTRDRKTGLLAKAVDNRFVDARNFRTEYSYNTSDENQFQYNWPAEVPIIDQRDQMHKRGWTYFRVNGEMDDQVISGVGQIPFVYNTSQDHPAWMSLQIGNNLEIIDCNDGARLRQADGTVIAYPAGTFFKGLARPWMGMHTINIVRRDAVAEKVWFQTQLAKNKQDAIVTFYNKGQYPGFELIYTIDLINDLIKNITFDVNGQASGSLIFSYIQDIDPLSDGFSEPVIPAGSKPLAQGQGMKWLISLAQRNLGK